MIQKTYSELITITSYEDRFRYLSCRGVIGAETFGSSRWLNQVLYSSQEWRNFRKEVIIRDKACDMAHKDYEIVGKKIIIHHIVPLTIEDILNRAPCVFDLNNVVCVSDTTHKALHYGDISNLPTAPTERKPFDTCPWKH